MASEEEKAREIEVPCMACGGLPRNHRVCATFGSEWEIKDHGIVGGGVYQICQCCGCESVRFRLEEWCSEDINTNTGDPIPVVKIYPQTPSQKKRIPVETSSFPRDVARIYSETIIAFNAGANTLAGGGLRATVEGLCADKNVKGTLEEKIDALVKQKLLAETQAELLHEERYLGNESLHELTLPSDSDLRDGLDIIEGLLNTIYSLPQKAERLKLRRTRKKTATSSKTSKKS